ncbi:sel1 repeat family protein, partial [Akkermansiaceae bacterium]|nr:sel1 repeat family protein [Akkermansiaceae bacterium]
TAKMKHLLLMAFAILTIGCGEEKPIEVKKPIETEIPFQKRAEAGDAEAQQELGRMYASGNGVPQDYSEAVKWFRMAAEQGDARGQHRLGVMYELGYGVPQDYAEATKWIRKSAEQNYYGSSIWLEKNAKENGE